MSHCWNRKNEPLDTASGQPALPSSFGLLLVGSWLAFRNSNLTFSTCLKFFARSRSATPHAAELKIPIASTESVTDCLRSSLLCLADPQGCDDGIPVTAPLDGGGRMSKQRRFLARLRNDRASISLCVCVRALTVGGWVGGCRTHLLTATQHLVR